MTRSVVGVHEAKTHLSQLLERVIRGEEVLIARRGRVVAHLVPPPVQERRLGLDVGRLDVPADFDAPLPDELFVSVVSAWEIAIKVGIGRLALPEDAATWVPSRTRALGAVSVPVTQTDALGVADLPPVHRDPFDRLLVVHAGALDASLMTADAIFADYPVEVVHAG